MAEHQWTALCHDSIIDKETLNITLYRSFSHFNITIPKPPDWPKTQGVYTPFAFQVISCFARGNEDEERELNARLEMIAPDGRMLLTDDYRIDLRQSLVHHQRSLVQRLPVTGSGRYVFRVLLGEAERLEVAGETTLFANVTWIDDDSAQYVRQPVRMHP